jgi:hypothetical protein
MNGLTIWKKFLLTRLVVLTIPIAIVAGVSGCGGAKILQESVVVRDTVVVTKERVLHDTLIVQKDTILYQDRVRVEVKYLEGKRVVITAECPSDTIRVETIRDCEPSYSEARSRLGRSTWLGYCYPMPLGHHPNYTPKTLLRCFTSLLSAFP